jgi:hypothetical protein
MTRTTRLRLMILQLRQILFTDASTFIAVSFHKPRISHRGHRDTPLAQLPRTSEAAAFSP